MRIIIVFLLFICLLQQPAITQTSRPSQKEMQTQMQEAKREGKKQITELENQIAEAKIKEEAPETIKEMEDRLAMMKKMLGIMDEATTTGNKRPKTLPATKTVLPKYVSPIIPIPLKEPVVAPTEDQAKDQLLWYSGKKINDSTLVTTNKMIVRYSKQRNMVIIKPDEKKDTTSYVSLAANLGQTEKLKNDFAVNMSGTINSFFMFPEILKAYKEFDILRDRYYDVAKNNILIHLPPGQLELEGHYMQLVNLMNNLQPLTAITRPPEWIHTICGCDLQKRKDYERYLNDWAEKFGEDEDLIWESYQRIYSYMEAFPAAKSVLNATMNIKSDLKKALGYVIERKTRKLWELSKLYQQGDIYIEDGLVLATISLDKLLHEIGGNIERETERLKADGYVLIDRIKNLVLSNTVFDKFLREQKNLRNYNVVFDYNFHMHHERNKSLLNPSYVIPFSKVWNDGLSKFNRFTLSINMDFALEEKGDGKVMMTASGILKSKDIIVSLGRSGCKWVFYIAGTNYGNKNANEESFLIPIKVVNGTKDYLFDKLPPIVYTGPDSMKMVLEKFRISFCKDGGKEIKDSAYMGVLRYTDADQNKYSNTDPAKNYTTDMLGYANKMLLGAIETKTNINDLISVAGQMMTIQSTSPMPPSTGNPFLDQLKMEHLLYEQKSELQGKLPEITHTENTIIPFDANNGDAVFIFQPHTTVDPNDKDKNYGIILTRGWITLKVVHTPLP